MDDLKIFENKELNLYVRTLPNSDGSISINAEDTAIGYGWTQEKKGRIYPRWETLNGYCKDLGFSQLVGKDVYIPESLFYRLGMKANNAVADKFQNWLALEVIPEIRKTGSYRKKSAVEQLRLTQQAILEVDEKISAVDEDLQTFKQDMPILGIEESRITAAVKRKGVECLGGKESEAYQDKSLRGKVYADIYGQLKREFGVFTYKAIKRSQCEKAIEVIQAYNLPLILEEAISDCNAQMCM